MLTILNDNPDFPKRNYILDDLCDLEKSINRVNLGEVNSEDKPEYNIQAVIPRTKVRGLLYSYTRCSSIFLPMMLVLPLYIRRNNINAMPHTSM